MEIIVARRESCYEGEASYTSCPQSDPWFLMGIIVMTANNISDPAELSPQNKVFQSLQSNCIYRTIIKTDGGWQDGSVGRKALAAKPDGMSLILRAHKVDRNSSSKLSSELRVCAITCKHSKRPE